MNAAIIKRIKPFVLFYKYKKSKRKIRKIIKKGGTIFLELGAGEKKGRDGWLTIDVTKNCDICWDLRKGIPFPNGSVSKIYSSHFLEHLTYREQQFCLDECLRVLIPGGTFSVCVPNTTVYMEAYLNRELNIDKYLYFTPAYNNTTRIDYVNYIAYMDGLHKYMFDEENLVHILKTKGMKNVRIREFDPNVDMKEREFESIYAIGEK